MPSTYTARNVENVVNQDTFIFAIPFKNIKCEKIVIVWECYSNIIIIFVKHKHCTAIARHKNECKFVNSKIRNQHMFLIFSLSIA